MKRFLFLIWLVCSSVLGIEAAIDSTLIRDKCDSIQVSLVTCSPGTEVYAVYGHTALRYEIPDKGVDLAINYGLFSFEAPNFLWRFVKGETDYVVGCVNYAIFEREYRERGSSVTLQELNLSEDEKLRLAQLVADNLRPENREYRYNFLYNNCSTKARDIVFEAMSADFMVDTLLLHGTYRTIIHQYTEEYEWLQFGIDYLLGMEADYPISPMEQMFAPEYLKAYVSGAELKEGEQTYPFLMTEDVIEPIAGLPSRMTFPLAPMQLMVLLLLFTLVVCAFELWVERRQWWFDVLLFGMQGLMGCIVAFLFLFSVHPTAGSNIHVIYLNPLPLLLLPMVIFKQIKRVSHPYYWIMLALLVAFVIVSLFVGQYIQPAAYVFVVTLMVRVVHNGWLYQLVKNLLQKEDIHHKRRVIKKNLYLLIPFLVVPSALVAGEANVPKMVVSIVVDQLRADYLEKYSNLYCEDGFKKLWAEARVFTGGYFDYANPDRSSATASVYTGTVPYYHGITGDKFLERKTLKVLGCVDDKRYEGIGTELSSSPFRMVVTNLADELKMATNGHACVVSIAAERDVAVLAGGHAPNAVLWLSDDQALWASSSYYGGLPGWVSSFNKREGSKFDFKTLKWEPYFPTGVYTYSLYDGIPKSFRHTFRDERFVLRYKTSACVNDEITTLAKTVLSGHLFGRNQTTDMLCLGYYAGNYEHAPEWERSIELQDIYCRLDRNIAELISLVDKKVGLENALFVITSTGYTDASRPNEKLFTLPTGEINMSRLQALLNLYLGALYGKDSYIEACYMNEIYLNHALIEQRQLKMSELLERCAEFLNQVEGVKQVYPSHELLSGSADPVARAAYHTNRSGDIVLEIAPGYTLVDERWNERCYVRRSNVPVPIIFYGLGMEPAVDRSPVSVSVVAPTMANMLKISVPNACVARPIDGM